MSQVYDVIAIDVETTGYSPKWDRVIQIGGVALQIFDQKFRVTGVLDLVVNPGMDVTVPLTIQQLTGLTRERLNNGMPMPDALDKLQEFLNIPQRGGLKSSVTVVGHNVVFDLRFLATEAQNLGRVLRMPGRAECTMEAARQKGWGTLSLTDLAQKYGVAPTSGFHCAVYDAITTLACWRRMAGAFFGAEPVIEVGYDISEWQNCWHCTNGESTEVIALALKNRRLVEIEAAF